MYTEVMLDKARSDTGSKNLRVCFCWFLQNQIWIRETAPRGRFIQLKMMDSDGQIYIHIHFRYEAAYMRQ